MSAAWPSAPLGKIVDHRKEFITIDDLTTYRRPRVQLHAQGIVLRDALLGAEIKTKKQQVARAGEFLVAEIDAKVGGFGIMPDNLDGAIVSSHYFLYRHRPECLDNKYLGWFVKTRAFRQQVEAQGSTNYAAIRPDDVLGYEIPLPPLDEQRRIVSRIEELAAKVEEARHLGEQTRTGTKALTTSAAAHVLDKLARSAPKYHLRSVVAIRGGGTPPKDAPHFWGGTIPWITPKDMKRRALSDAIDHITEIATRDSSAKLIDPGAVLVVVRGMILAHTFPAAVLQASATINQDMKALIPDKRLLPEYLCAVLWTWNPRVLELVDRSGHDTRKLNTDKLLAFEIPLPSIQEQRCIVAELDALQTKVDFVKALQNETSRELDAMLPAILDKAFKGELV
jgi:type I restriction enzyme S subunit